MKLLHTADWHIGQNFFGYDRKEEHTIFFDWLKEQVKEYQVDVLLVSGDIFDSPNPSAESQKLYYQFLRQVSIANTHLQIIIVAGNHDSAGRLEAPSPLLEEMNVSIKGIVKRTPEGEIDYNNLLIPLKKDRITEAWCIAVPYLRQGDYPLSESYSKGVAAMYTALYEELSKIKAPEHPVIVMGHLQATGSELSDNDRSERTIIGGLECVSPEVFDKQDIVYTALGHLHKAQQVSGRENVRYAGSPLPMSFAEKNYKQGVNLLNLNDGKVENIERIEFTAPVKLMSLPKEPKSLSEVLDELEQLPDGEITTQSPYLEIKVLITEPEPSMRHQIEEALKGKSVRLTRIAAITTRRERKKQIMTYEELQAVNPLEMAKEVFRSRYDNEMPDEMAKLLQSVIREVEL